MCSLRLAAFISIVKRVEEQGSAYQSGFGPFCSKSYMGLASIRRFMSHCSFYNLLIYICELESCVSLFYICIRGIEVLINFI